MRKLDPALKGLPYDERTILFAIKKIAQARKHYKDPTGTRTEMPWYKCIDILKSMLTVIPRAKNRAYVIR